VKRFARAPLLLFSVSVAGCADHADTRATALVNQTRSALSHSSLGCAHADHIQVGRGVADGSCDIHVAGADTAVGIIGAASTSALAARVGQLVVGAGSGNSTMTFVRVNGTVLVGVFDRQIGAAVAAELHGHVVQLQNWAAGGAG
jgi:hypothetical protein